MNKFMSKAGAACQILIVALLLVVWTPAQAQLSTGTVRGTVAGAPAGVRVEAINPETGVLRAVETREDGSYVISGLRPATYTIKAVSQNRAFEQVVRLQVA